MSQTPETNLDTQSIEGPLIDLTDVSKTFAKTIRSNQRRLARAVLRDLNPFQNRRTTLRENEFLSLDSIDLKIRRGEAVGLIGHNGAGKTTLLRILAGHLPTDSGRVSVQGDVSDLINLTAGYQKTLSGRENVFIGGALRGKSRKQMLERLDDIIAFSELDEFMEAPFGGYSLGMKMRLGFAVAVHTDPDILLIDEVLGVGDLRFRNKCLGKLQELKEQTAFVLVTHSMSQIRDFCDRAIMLEKGQIIFDGEANGAADLYEQIMHDTPDAERVEAPTVSTGPTLTTNGAVKFLNAKWNLDTDQDGALTPTLVAQVDIQRAVKDLRIGLMIYDEAGAPLTSLSDPTNVEIKAISSGPSEIAATLLGLRLNPGLYPTVLTLRDDAELLFRQEISVLKIPQKGGRPWGRVQASSRWSAQPIISEPVSP